MNGEKWHGASLESTSLAWEAATGADSIPTIERAYARTSAGDFLCVWPGCEFAHQDAEATWRHVHSHRELEAFDPPAGLPPDDFDPGPYL